MSQGRETRPTEDNSEQTRTADGATENGSPAGAVSQTGCCEVIVTGPDGEWLAGFLRRLVEDRVAACGHLIDPIRSIYRWEGAVHDEREARVCLHTRTSLVPDLVQRARQEHPYDVPCVIALPITDGHPDYLDWIVTQTSTQTGT